MQIKPLIYSLREKITLTIFMIVCFSAGMNAQTHYSSNVAIGGKLGLDFSRIFFNPHVTQGMLTGTTFGFTARYIEENHFGLIGECNFAQRGWTENFEGAPYKYSRTLNFVDICFLAHIYFGGRVRFFFNAGPQAGLYLGEKVTANFNPEEMQHLPDFPNINRINEQMLLPVNMKFDYGISASLGCEYNLNKRNSISLEGRFYFGLANVFSTKRADTFNASNQMTVSVSAGYWFRVK
ncbi:MAG: PorT family protein [Muribaculaceae bacterium]|nr:PorT family protein [Muribaculaceae bacterium]